MQLHTVFAGAKGPDEFPAAFASVAQANVGGMIVLGDLMLRINRKAIIALAAYNKLPVVYGPRDYAEDGGLGLPMASVFPVTFDALRDYPIRFLREPSPGDLPVEQPTKLKPGHQSKECHGPRPGEVPPTLLARADEVIE